MTDASEYEYEAADPELLSALHGISALAARVQAIGSPTPGSLAAADGVNDIGRYPYQLSAMALTVTIDHLEAWRALYVHAKHAPIAAHLALLRAALEGAVLVRWLCEPGLSRDERRSRGLGAYWEELNERRKLEEVAGLHPPTHSPGRPAAERLKQLEKRAAAVGLAITKPIRRVERAERYAFPAATQEPPRTGNLVYRLLSGPGHSSIWGTLVQADREIVGDVGTAMPIVKLTGSTKMMRTSTVIVLIATARAIDEFESYAAGS